MSKGRTWWAAIVAGVLALGVARSASAQATVQVQVRTPDGKVANGKVVLEGRGEERRYSCTTREGKCSIEGVPGGRYEVRLEPRSGEAPPPRKVMIPPSGEVTLIVSTGG